MSGWTYDESAHRYRGPDGKFLSPSSQLGLRNDFVERQRGAVSDLSDRLASGDLGVQAWEKEMQAAVKQTHGVQAAFGRGGRQQMTDADWQRVAETVKGQWKDYLRPFAQQIADGQLSAAQVATRAQMYLDGSVASYERGRSASFGLPELDQYPGDGQTVCLARCRCHLEYEEGDGEWLVSWRLGAADHCGDCADMASAWNPLSVPMEGERAVPLRLVGRGHAA